MTILHMFIVFIMLFNTLNNGFYNILQIMNNDSELQSRASNVLFQLSRKASLRELRDMVNMGLIEGLMSCVTKFKTQDEVTAQTLNYSGDTFNFVLVRNSLKMLSTTNEMGDGKYYNQASGNFLY